MNSEAPRHAQPDGSRPASELAPTLEEDPFLTVLRVVGSLWFAAVLLVMILAAMACATVFESSHSPEQALRCFYRAWWFKLLLGLLGVNSLTAIVLRYPFTRRHIGFVLTHASILIILAGALVSERWALNGQVSIAEGQSVDHFVNRDQEVITVTNLHDRKQTELTLNPRIFGGFDVMDRPDVPSQTVESLTIGILRYIPDCEPVERITDDGARPENAVEVALSTNEQGMSAWAFQNQSASLGPLSVGFRMIADAAELAKLIAEHPTTQPASTGVVKIEHNGKTFEIPLASCMDAPAPVGETGYTVHVLRYLPHATVGQGGQIANASDNPVNPFIEAELSGPGGTEKRLAFARFPEFSSMHSSMQKGAAASQASAENMKLTFVTAAALGPNTPIEVLGGPDGKLYVRLVREDGTWTTHALQVGESVETPWAGRTFTVVRKYEHARRARSVEPVEPVRSNRTPAILVKAGGGQKDSEVWLRKDEPQAIEAGGMPWSLTYSDQSVPLGFRLTLNRFRMGLYPGENSPRTYESHITVVDTATGREETKTISMNRPVTFGSLSLFQSSFRQGGGQQTTSVLSVSDDPGQPIVFFGYVTMLVGMIIVLVTRMRDRRRVAAFAVAAAGRQAR